MGHINDLCCTEISGYGTTNIPIGWKGGRQAGSHKVAGKAYIFTKNSQMTSVGSIFTSTCHTKQLNPWLISSASCVMNHSQLSACQGKMGPFEGCPSTRGCQAGSRKRAE